MVQRLTAAPSAPLREKAAALLGRIETVAEKADAAPRMGFRDLHTLRRAIDDVAYDSPVESRAMREQLQHVRGIVENEIERAIQAHDPEALAEYTLNKKRFEVANWAEGPLSERVNVRDRANRGLSLTDYKTGLGAAIAAGSGGLAALPIGLASAVGNKILRERGWSTFATLARKAAGDAVNVGAAPAAALPTARSLQTVLAHAEERLNSGIGTFLGSTGTGPRGIIKRAALSAALRSGDLDEARAAYRDHAREVQAAAAMPEQTAARLASITGPTLPTVAPGLHADMSEIAGRATNYMAANMPAPPTNPESITPQLDEPPPIAHSEINRYADRAEGVEDPLSILDDLSRGYVSPEKVDAVKNVWPELFERMRQTVFLNLAQRTKEQGPIPHEQRVLLDLTLDGNGSLEPSLRRESLQVMQFVRSQIGQQPQMPKPQRMPQLSKLYETRSSRLAMR
jgi:hypothetical protein